MGYENNTYLLNEITRLKAEIADIRKALQEREEQMNKLEKSSNLSMMKVADTLNKLSEQIEEAELAISASVLENKDALYDVIQKENKELHEELADVQTRVDGSVNSMKMDVSNAVNKMENVPKSIENLEEILQEKADRKIVIAMHQRLTTMFSLGIVNLVGSIMILALLSYLIFSLAR